MKVALMSDIHANLPALEAVLEDIRPRGVDAIWNMGDMLGYGAFPDEVVNLIKQEKIQNIIGNYDLKVLKVKQKKDNWKKGVPPEKWIAYSWAYGKLSKSSINYLISLNEEIKLESDGKKILIKHSALDPDEEHLTPDSPDEKFREIASQSGADIIIFGHSHIPFKKKVDGVWFINPGSVGRPGDGDPKASYAIMTFQPKVFHVIHYRVDYDVEKAVSAIREGGLPDIFAEMISEGHSFETAKEEEEKEPVENDVLKASITLAKSCGYEETHSNQVTRISLNLFDELQPLHELGEKERFLLHNAAIMHDIGWIEGQNKHHKTALKIILEDTSILFDEKERLIVGSIARYHRATLPKKKHAHFSSLDPSEQRSVQVLSSILRVADGLDRTHQSIVKSVLCEVKFDRIIIKCEVTRPSEADRQAALDKGKLMQKVFKRDISIEWKMQ
jgi:putative phosphoesterase